MAKNETLSGSVSEDVLHLQDLLLLRQARSVDLNNRDDRLKSRDRLQTFFFDLQRMIKPGLSLEIGAHSAAFSQRMDRLGAQAHAFEANPHNYKAFAPKLERQSPKVRYHHMAVSDVDGEITFQVKESRDGKALNKIAGNNSLLVRNDPSFVYESVTVASTRLDSFLNSQGLAGQEYSAWVDVEGALSKVTAGFGDALQGCLSLIVEVEEVSYWQGQMLFFDAMRYFGSQNLVPVARDFEAPHQYNLVYLSKEVLLRPNVRLLLARFLRGD